MFASLPISTKPYLLRAVHEWCVDQGFTPYMLVTVDESVVVPKEFVRDGQIVLNVSYDATSQLQIGQGFVKFKARFGGVMRNIEVPLSKVVAMYAKEAEHGMWFEEGEADQAEQMQAPAEAGSDSGDAPPTASPASPPEAAGAPGAAHDGKKSRPGLVLVK